jgi:hypothetical protein
LIAETITAGVSRVSCAFLCMHVVVTTPAGTMKTVRSSLPSLSAFPDKGAGRHLHRCFRGLLNVHSHYNLHARRIAYTILYTEGFNDLVT